MAPSHGDITVHGALETMLSSGQKNRMEGVSNLKLVFEHKSKSSNLDALKDGAYHSIFEALFTVARAEKQAYLVARTPTTKSKAEKSLQMCSDVLRMTIRAAAQKLKKKTVKAVIEHVIQLLPAASGEYCAGLSQFYLKVLGTLLEHEAHVEHLEAIDWTRTVDFCLQGINNYDRPVSSEYPASLQVATDSELPASVSGRNSTVMIAVRASGSRSSVNSVTKRNSEELLECLLYLISASNAPILTRIEEILHGIMHFLRSHGFVVSPIHQVAFSALNFTLSVTNADRAFLIQSLAPDIVPIIERLWSSKSLSKDEMLNSVKDEMLVTILLLRLHLERVASNTPAADFQTKIEELERALRNDYTKRIDKDQLQLDDLDLGALGKDILSFNISITVGIVRLRPHAARIERKWAILKSLCVLDGLLYVQSTSKEQGKGEGDDEADNSRYPRKRRRIMHQIDRLGARIASPDVGERLVALQTLLFMLPSQQLSKEALDNLLYILLPCIVDKRGGISSWAMLAIAFCSQQATSRSCSFDWPALWHTVARLITTSTTCRAACFLLHSILASELVLYKDVAEDVDVILNATEISTPVILCDTSLSLMMHFLHVRNLEVPGSSLAACHNVIRWLSTRWTQEDKSFTARFSIDLHPIDIVNLLRTCLTLPILHLSPSRETTLGLIGQAWIQESESEDVMRYLLLLNPTPRISLKCSACKSFCGLYEDERISDNSPQGLITKQLILDLLLPKFETLLREWKSYSRDESAHVSTDTLRYSTSTTILGYLVLSLVGDLRLRGPSEQLDDTLKTLTKLSIEQLRSADDYHSLSEALLQAAQPYLPASISCELQNLNQLHEPLVGFFSSIAKHISISHSSAAHITGGGVDGSMDLDDIFDPQHSRSKWEGTKTNFSRQTSVLAFSPAAFYSAVSLRVALVSQKSQALENSDDLPPAFVDHIVSLQTQETLLCSQFLREVLHSNLSVSLHDTTRLIEHTGDIISSTAYDTCEVALVLCLDVLAGSVSAWASPGAIGDISDSTRQLYEWFVMVELPKRRPSLRVQSRLAHLLFELIRIQPTYGEEFEPTKPPSVQSCLFDILHRSPMITKFHIARQLPDMFGLFLLKDHAEILRDVIESLPSDPDWAEGIAFRLHAVSLLASRWPTLIRQCTYYILEVPGNLPDSVNHATRCVATVSAALDLQGPRALFRLFASQLLYTWLITEPVSKVPYQIFGYGSLQDLVYDSQEEIVGLMIMRSQDDEVNRLAALLETSHEELLQRCFSKVIAYSVAHDISVPRAENGKKYVSGETRVRKRLGNELFYSLVNQHFADIIALFFNLIDQEEQVEKSFLKSPTLIYAANIMNDIKSTCCSAVVSPPNQQPAFKAKYLTSEIEHLCGRTEYEVNTLYSPSMIVFIARCLLNSLHPALGSLHACAVLRKLRVLIALSGAGGINGYPLEMLLHSLRQFITDPECADDAIGMAQYLLRQGSAYLSTVPSYVIGVSLVIIASLRGFLDTSPSSTTQQSQYQLTLSKAQAFHNWLGLYLVNYDTNTLSLSSKTAFRSLAQSAHAFRSVANADNGTSESDLLLEILEDERSGRHLLEKSSRNLAVSQLYSTFKQPKSFRTDLFGVDIDAVGFAPTLWALCRDAELRGPFLIWAAKVLGRAFAATGHVHQQFKQESKLRHILETGPLSRLGGASESRILHLLQALTLEGSHRTAGLAEAALRVILSIPGTDTVAFGESVSESLYKASTWAPYHVPSSDLSISHSEESGDPYSVESFSASSWPRHLAVSLAKSISSDGVLYSLQGTLNNAKGFAEEAFPFIIHLVLVQQLDGPQVVKRQLSDAIRMWLNDDEGSAKAHLKLLINTLLYLRTQQLPREKTSADRMNWLDVQYTEAAQAAVRCGMYKTALLFYEMSVSESVRTSRRSSMNKINKSTEPDAIQRSIFKNIDDPDIYYGLPQKPSLDTILARLEYEKDGFKSLAFRGAKYDTHLRQKHDASIVDSQALVNALGVLSLDGVSHSLLQGHQIVSLDPPSISSMFQTARKLEQWDLPVPAICGNEAITIYKTFQAINTAADRASVVNVIDDGLGAMMSRFIMESSGASTIHSSLQCLAVLTEMDEVLSASNSEEFEEMLGRFQSRQPWMKTGKFDDVDHILSCRETVLSTLSQSPNLRGILLVSASETRLVEVQTTLISSQLNRAHGALQEGLKSATYLASLIHPCIELGLNIDAAARLEAANALWEQGEVSSSIGMLQDLEKNSALGKQTIPIGRPDLLAKIGYQVSVARLEKPDRIIEKYLNPALKELKGKVEGNEAGQVFHEFAVFCDQQLQDADTIEDFHRLRSLKEMKESEVRDLNKMYKSATTPEQKHKYHGHLVKAKQWLQLDNEEYERLSSSSNELLRRSLENYLLSLTASDDHNNDALRFTALWLQHSELDMVNASVTKYLSSVPTYKFASLMNQLTSRLLDNDVKFQQLLFQLVLNLCTDHPYHGMYQIWAGSRTKSNMKDETAVSRQAATSRVGQQLSSIAKSAKIWSAISSTNRVYCQLAVEKNDTRYKQGQKIQLKDSPAGATLSNMLSRYPIPPPTMQVDIAVDLNYSMVPSMLKLEPLISIASGVSAPKIITVVANNGARYKQLVKGGNDDLRQDAIMEQVFSQVSELLAANTSTRQRNLAIRTYKVLPLSSNAGIIEFVSNTIPLHEYLMPAHERYYPKDLKGTQCRKEIGDVQTQRLEVRLKKYRAVTDQFHPVMRYFFMEKFYDPDEWFARRLAYTRSTAAISMLGHILGLGDRHGHNILLDEKTGEAVHIDLGVAFEMGRVLPVPELVPFRLTRDIVDGMGITKTEGVYRRCCEFTLEALRKESYSIMTILDVLRYDPLYSWSISPVRLAKLQDAQSAAPPPNSVVGAAGGVNKTREVVNQPSEADRALTVVKKKLSKTLSVTATVNNLINQATDEKNLAVLYSGWAAYV